MRAVRRLPVLAGIVAVAIGLTVPGASASLGPRLKWRSPTAISDGVKAVYRSGGNCPDTRPDGSPIQGERKVQIEINFNGGGGMGDVAPVNSDGSWRFVHAFNAGGFQDPSAKIHATCVDVTDTGFIIARYVTHRISVNP
jgi:hypothetical protein